MTRISLDERWQRKLLDIPESGMGYQRVHVTLKDGRIVENAVALNAQVLQVPDDGPDFGSTDIAAVEVAP